MSDSALAICDTKAFTDPVGIEDEDRHCSHCGKRKPTAAFRTPTSVVCKICRRNENRGGQVQRLKDLLAEQFVAAARGDRLDAPRISQICAEMFKRQGGVEEFCEKWSKQIDEVAKNRPGSKLALDQFRALANLAKDSTSSIDEANAATKLTDEDLERIMQDYVETAVARVVDQGAELLEDDSEKLDDEDAGED